MNVNSGNQWDEFVLLGSVVYGSSSRTNGRLIAKNTPCARLGTLGFQLVVMLSLNYARFAYVMKISN